VETYHNVDLDDENKEYMKALAVASLLVSTTLFYSIFFFDHFFVFCTLEPNGQIFYNNYIIFGLASNILGL
jgi:lipopolysaccharide assembly outer membrane protein LptD (OstA)